MRRDVPAEEFHGTRRDGNQIALARYAYSMKRFETGVPIAYINLRWLNADPPSVVSYGTHSTLFVVVALLSTIYAFRSRRRTD